MKDKNREIEKKNRQADLTALILQNSIDDRFDYLVMLETLGEQEIDRVFWTAIFVKYVPQINPARIDFAFAAPPRTSGIKEIIKYLDFEPLFYQENSEFCVCIDSDSYYLRQERLTQNKPYVLQTYTYSVENHKFLPLVLNEWIQEKYHSSFDFAIFLTHYSQTIYEVFLYWVHLCLKEKQNRWLKEDWIKIIDFKKDASMLEDHGNRVCQIVADQIKEWKTNKELIDYQALNIYVQNLGIKPEECFLYINGHALEQIIKQILNKIRQKYIQEEVSKISVEEKENFINSTHYEEILQNIHQRCFNNPHQLVTKIGKDVKQFFSILT